MLLTADPYHIFYIAFDLAGILIDSVLIVYLISRYFTPRCQTLDSLAVKSVSIGGVFLVIYFAGYNRSFMWFISSIFIGCLLYSMIYTRGIFGWKLSVSCLYCTLYFVLDGIYMPVLFYMAHSMTLSVEFMEMFILVFRRLIVKFIIFAIVRFLVRNKVSDTSMVPAQAEASMIIFCIFNTMLLVLEAFYFSPDAEERVQKPQFSTIIESLFMAVSFCMILAFYYFYTTALKQYHINMSSRLMVKEEELHQQYLDQTQKFITAARQFRHDMKAHIFCMQGLLEQKKYRELEEYLKQFGESTFLHFPFVSYCGDISVNTILNQKMRKAQEAEIPVAIDVQLSNSFTVQKMDLCTIISNLCDNAIEASLKAKNPQISIDLSEKKGYLTLKVENSIDENILGNNPSLRTTKPDTNLHGLGVNIVREIAGRYGGSLDISCKDGKFTSFVLLENQRPACHSYDNDAGDKRSVDPDIIRHRYP